MPTTATPLRIVYLEDDRSAFELVGALVAADDLICQLEHVDTPAAYRQALSPRAPDLILADFNLPEIDGLTALAYKRELCPDTPFIFVSGSIGEEVALNSLRNGASDFVLKDSLARLPAAIRRALQEAQEHQQRLTAERKLRENEARYRLLAENAPDVIFRYVLAPVPHYDYVSPAVARITGYQPEEFYADPLLSGKITHPDDVHILRKMVESQAVPEGIHELRIRAKDGRELFTEQRFVPVHDEQGRLLALEGVARDITERKRERGRRHQLEAQLLQAQKMESIGALAGGIAHDFNNILTGILGFNELATMTLPPDHPLQEELGEVRKAGLRAKELVAQILTFSRKREITAAPIELVPAIEEAIKLVRAATPANIEILRQLSPGVVCADPTQIHQIVLNLCTNAVHAMKGRAGQLTVSLQPYAATQVTPVEVGQIMPGRYLCLLVRDTGRGMSEDTLQKIFAPFFTTKGAGEGTGLGLALIKSIVIGLGGAIRLHSRLDEGTTFEIYLPASNSVESPVVAPSAVRPGQGERIAVVDDESSISTFVAVRLEQLKYRPTVFNNPRDALRTLSASPSSFDALLTDLSMPELTGLELIKELRALGHSLPAILASGGGDTLSPAEIATLGIVHQLQKPFTGDDLAQTLQAALGR